MKNLQPLTMRLRVLDQSSQSTLTNNIDIGVANDATYLALDLSNSPRLPTASHAAWNKQVDLKILDAAAVMRVASGFRELHRSQRQISTVIIALMTTKSATT
jgi:hypothetical protein